MTADKCWIRLLNGTPIIVSEFPDLDHVIVTTGRDYLKLTRMFWRSLPLAR